MEYFEDFWSAVSVSVKSKFSRDQEVSRAKEQGRKQKQKNKIIKILNLWGRHIGL